LRHSPVPITNSNLSMNRFGVIVLKFSSCCPKTGEEINKRLIKMGEIIFI
jgi:hypothetical protein